jgi:membrane-associated phospholipid phosphatase
MRNYQTLVLVVVMAATTLGRRAELSAQLPRPLSVAGEPTDSGVAGDSAGWVLGAAPRPAQGQPGDFRWYHAGAVLGGIALASLLDESVRDQLQGHRSTGKDDVARVFRRMGEAEVFGPIGLGTIAVGIIAGNPRIRRAGERISGGLLLAGTLGVVVKEVVGRRRPALTGSAYRFKPFSGRDAWPSGHTTMAFALAASVGDEIHSTPVSIGLYGAAAMTGWSRLNDNRHWLSDVLAGAAFGITSAKLMNGHWRVFGVGAPRFLLEPERVGLSLQF